MITLLFAASLGIVLVWATREHERGRVFEDEGQRKDQRISELEADNHRLTVENLNQRQRSEETEASLKSKLSILVEQCDKLQAYVPKVESRMSNAQGKAAEHQTRSDNVSADNGMLEEQIRILFLLARSLQQERATRRIGKSLLEILRTIWPKPA
jgi:hypothetical protein